MAQPPDVFSESAARIGDLCKNMSLIAADRALDGARRFVWMRQFTGTSNRVLMGQLANEELDVIATKTAEILGLLRSMSIEQVEHALFEARLLLWMRAFGQASGTLFAEQLKAYMERDVGGAPEH